MDTRKILGGVGGVVGLGVVLAIKFLAPSAEVELKNAAGAGWTDARGELLTEITQIINTEYAVFAVDDGVKQKVSECIVDKSIEFLNSTDCSYLYNPSTTSEAEHLQAQEACLVKVKFEEKQSGYTVECSKSHFPDDWAIMRTIFTNEFQASFAGEGVAEAEAKTIGECISGKLVDLMNGKKVPLINKEAKSAEEMFFGIDKYIEDPAADEEFQAVIRSCTGQEEAPADEAAAE